MSSVWPTKEVMFMFLKNCLIVTMKPASVLLLLSFVLLTKSQNRGYYWRDYTGNIPPDAYTAGKDINDNNVYVGQVYVKDGGVIVVQIYSGNKEVSAPIYGAKKKTRGIKILCTADQNKLYWMDTTENTLHTDAIGKHIVLGGIEGDNTYLHVCRLQLQGEVKIGKVFGAEAGTAKCYYVDNGNERLVRSYQVLAFNGDSKNDYLPDIDVRSQ